MDFTCTIITPELFPCLWNWHFKEARNNLGIFCLYFVFVVVVGGGVEGGQSICLFYFIMSFYFCLHLSFTSLHHFVFMLFVAESGQGGRGHDD